MPTLEDQSQLKNLLYGLSARIFYGLDEDKKTAAQNLLDKCEQDAILEGLFPDDFKLLPLSDIFTEARANAIIDAYKNESREDLQQSILRVVLPLKIYVEEKPWNGIHLRIVEDCVKYDEETYSDEVCRTLCIGCVTDDKVSCSLRIDAIMNLSDKIIEATARGKKFGNISISILPPNPDDF